MHGIGALVLEGMGFTVGGPHMQDIFWRGRHSAHGIKALVPEGVGFTVDGADGTVHDGLALGLGGACKCGGWAEVRERAARGGARAGPEFVDAAGPRGAANDDRRTAAGARGRPPPRAASLSMRCSRRASSK